MNENQITIGMAVRWVAAGKVARLEKRNGKINVGVVEAIRENGSLSVRITHVAGKPFSSMTLASVDPLDLYFG